MIWRVLMPAHTFHENRYSGYQPRKTNNPIPADSIGHWNATTRFDIQRHVKWARRKHMLLEALVESISEHSALAHVTTKIKSSKRSIHTLHSPTEILQFDRGIARWCHTSLFLPWLMGREGMEVPILWRCIKDRSVCFARVSHMDCERVISRTSNACLSLPSSPIYTDADFQY